MQSGWNQNGEWKCPKCGTMIGKNLLGEKPFLLVLEHEKMHERKENIQRRILCFYKNCTGQWCSWIDSGGKIDWAETFKIHNSIAELMERFTAGNFVAIQEREF